MKKNTNQLYDINHFPLEPGILVFGISMGKISNSQNAKKCFEHMEFLAGKIKKPQVGLNFIYSDYLYFNSDEKASTLKNNYLTQIISHKNHFLKILSKNQWYIEKSFSFTTWNQAILDIKDWTTHLGKIRELYKKDKHFRQYLEEDAKSFGKTLDENQVNFFLEEILFFYLLRKGKIKLNNEFIQNHEKWILPCYPGKPLFSEIYLFQLNPFRLSNPKNKYENSYYDLEDKKVHHYLDTNLEEFRKHQRIKKD